jgi:hypothetical protein
MTSLKKPLIAIASAVALVTSALVAAPANAAISAALTVNNVAVTAAATTADPVLLPVPADNSVDSADALKVVVTVAANTAVTATATGVKLVSATATVSAPVTASAGAATFSANSGSGTTVTFYAFTTSTTAGSVVVTVGGDSTTYVVKGTAGAAYTLATSVPTVAGLGVDVDFTAIVTDVFGNAVTGATISTSVLRGTVKTALTYDATDKRYEGVITTPTAAGSIAGISKITATDVAGLAKATTEVAFSISAADLASQVTTLDAALTAKTAELTAKNAELAALKAKFNALAKKYNTKVTKKYQVKLVK